MANEGHNHTKHFLAAFRGFLNRAWTKTADEQLDFSHLPDHDRKQAIDMVEAYRDDARRGEFPKHIEDELRRNLAWYNEQYGGISDDAIETTVLEMHGIVKEAMGQNIMRQEATVDRYWDYVDKRDRNKGKQPVPIHTQEHE